MVAASVKNNAVPLWVIDLHGMREVLSTKKNSTKVAIIDAIEKGDMQILRSVSDELKAIYPDLYEDFKLISPKKYMKSPVVASVIVESLMECYDAGIFGSIPSAEHFEAVAVAHHAGVVLVTSGKGLSDCQKIVKKCELKPHAVQSVQDVVSAIQKSEQH